MSGPSIPGSHGTPDRVRVLLDDLRRSVGAEIEQLGRFGEELQRSTASLVEELRGVLGELDGDHASPPSRPAEPARPAGSADPPADSIRFDTAVSIDAGPFSGLEALDAFLHAVRRVPGARDVSIRGFQGDRATFDVRLAWPIALVPALREQASSPFSVSAAGHGHLALFLRPPAERARVGGP